MANQTISGRSTVFISKATPGDDEFVLWLAPRLEAAGYTVFADILCLESGGRWRKQITNTLQNNSIKMLLCCQDSTLNRDGVQEEIGIATDLSKELGDPTFIIPLKLKRYKKLFGIGELQYVDFEAGWAAGLEKLLDALEKQNVPKGQGDPLISPDWEAYRSRSAISIIDSPEFLTSNWLRILELPDTVKFFEPTGAVDHSAMKQTCARFEYPAESYERGFFSFASIDDVLAAFINIGPFSVKYEVPIDEFLERGFKTKGINSKTSKNMIVSMIRKAWENLLRQKGFIHYTWSKQLGFHAGENNIEIGKKVPWGRQGEKRSSMLRNLSNGFEWRFGATGIPALWPYPHMKLKTRVLFCEPTSNGTGAIIDDKDKQHRLRRKNCKGWRNKQWHGRMLAMLELISGESAHISLFMGSEAVLLIDATPIQFIAPVTTDLPNMLSEDDEEIDETTLVDVRLEFEEQP